MSRKEQATKMQVPDVRPHAQKREATIGDLVRVFHSAQSGITDLRTDLQSLLSIIARSQSLRTHHAGTAHTVRRIDNALSLLQDSLNELAERAEGIGEPTALRGDNHHG